MKKSHFRRLFSEFPFLWGIKQCWHHEEDLIEVHVASVETFHKDLHQEPWSVWVFGSGVQAFSEQSWIRTDSYNLIKAEVVGSDSRLGAVAFLTAETWFGLGVEYVAISRTIPNEQGATHVQIFRVPRGTTTFWDFLQQYQWQEVSEEGGCDGN